MEALNQVPAHLRILACPQDCVKDFTPLAEEAGFELFAGPKDDVLERYCMVIRHFGIDYLIRATGDNPFVFADAAAAINAEALTLGSDYAGFSGLPPGAGVEAVKAQTLLHAGEEASGTYDHEHVCPYLYTHPEKFLLHRPLAPIHWKAPDIGLTVDTEEDYKKAQILYAELEKFSANGERYKGSVIIKTFREIFPVFSAEPEGRGSPPVPAS